MVHIGVGSNVRILDLGTSKWSFGVLESLPALQAISGCDSINTVNGKEKAKWLSTVQKKYLRVFAKCILTVRYNKNKCRYVSKN